MKIELEYVIGRPSERPKYFYFRYGVDSRGRGGKLIPLRGRPGTLEFEDHYQQLLAEHAPQVLRVKHGGNHGKGTLGWVIEAFTAPTNDEWTKLGLSTQQVYRRHFDWLRKHYGDILLAAFDKQMVRRIRDLRKQPTEDGRGGPSVANMTVDKIGQLWDWAEEYAGIILPGDNPARQVAGIKYESQSALAWPQPLCTAFESQPHQRMTTFYFLARYTGQRKGDCCNMRWTDFDPAGKRIFVVQEKTGTKVWVPAHIRLRNYLANLPHESEFILTSPKGGAYRKTSVTNLVCSLTNELGHQGYSPHGLRHLAGVALAEAGCTVPQIMAVLGHLTEKQANLYWKQANRTRLADDAIALLERAEHTNNVVTLHAPTKTNIEQSMAKLENQTGKSGAK